MNDLDLRAALHRDADLVGEPSPDLLDQLSRRRQHQRRQRAGLMTAGLAVVVIGAGIPVATSFMTQSDTGPATDPTPAISTEAPPTTAAPPTAPVVVLPPPVETPVVDAPVDVSPACPDRAVVEAALPADTARVIYEADHGDPVCSGIWAGFGYGRTEIIQPGDTYQGFDDQDNPVEIVATEYEERPDGTAGLLRYENGSWTFHKRDDYCNKVTLPDMIWESVCNVD